MKTINKLLSAIIILSIYMTGYADESQTLNDFNKNEIIKEFKIKTTESDNYFLENGIWYTYVYKEYKKIGNGVILSKDKLLTYGLDTNKTLLVLDNNNGIYFVTNYKKVKLISDNIISGVSNKKEFLNQLVDDKKYLLSDTDELFIRLKNETLKLTKGLNTAGKIYKIYDYILTNTDYSITFDINNKEIFSGISTYENNIGICGGYSKFYLYMLSFAGIKDVEVINGTVIDANNFQNIGHAWVRIGKLYFDLTFDDPIGALKDKTFSEYKYFGLPIDLFYADRFDYGTLPEYLKTTSLEYRKNLINENLSQLTSKYENKNYLLLKSFTFKENNQILFSEKMTIKKLENIIPTFEVNNYKFKENNQTKKIINIKYYTINDTNIETLLKQLNYNLEGYKLLKWDNGTYRLVYSIITDELAFNY
ncbi:MAG: hypothetical protein QM490_01515 [Candidatus Gracilibacteria bacterium]